MGYHCERQRKRYERPAPASQCQFQREHEARARCEISQYRRIISRRRWTPKNRDEAGFGNHHRKDQIRDAP